MKLDLNKVKKSFKTLLLIAKGRSSDEVVSEFDRYIGIGTFGVLGVNPTKEELSKVYGREVEKDQEYTGKYEVNGESVDTVRVSFLVTTTDDKDNSGIDYTGLHTIFLRNRVLISSRDGEDTKVKVIDNYGQTAWATEEQLKNQEVPTQRNGKYAKIIAPYRPMIDGEDQLVEFIRIFLGIKEPMEYKNDMWVPTANLDESLVSFAKVADFFKGDVSEIKEALKIQPDNKIKLMLGVRTTDDNRQYQEFFPDRVMRFTERNHNKTAKILEERKASGAYANTEFSTEKIHVYSVEPTSFAPMGITDEKLSAIKDKWFKK